MKLVPLIATAILSLGIGIFIGKSGEAKQDKEEGRVSPGTEASERPRAVRRSGGSGGNDARRIGKVGSPPPEGYDNRIKHMMQLAKEVEFGRGMPDFDALFGVWQTVREMSLEEVRMALEEFDNENTSLRDGFLVKAMLVMQLAKKDGPSAMAYADEMNRERSFPAREMAIQAWVKSDPKGAYTWYEANKEELNPRENMKFQASAIIALAKEDFESAFSKAKKVDNLSRKDVLEGLGAVAVLDAEHRERFTKYVVSLKNEDIIEEVGESMAVQLAQENVQDAVDFVEKWPGEDKSELYEEVAEEWARVEPEKALAWRLDKPGAMRDVDDMFGDWARRDSAAAQVWLSNQGNQDARIDKDELRVAAARRVTWNDDYPEAAKWAGSITDQEKRHNSYQSIYRRWSRLDEDGAKRWAEGLDDAAREVLIPQGN